MRKELNISVGQLILAVLFAIACPSFYNLGKASGAKSVKDSLPSCIYVGRDAQSATPYGYDGKPGIDVATDFIHGGGYYVSMEAWKK